MMKSAPILFPKVDLSKNDSIGFIVLAEILGLNYQTMGDLANRIDEFNKVDYKELKDALVQVTKMVEKYLGTFIASPSSKGKKNGSLVCHSELQVASYIIVLFLLNYDLSVSEGLVKNTTHSKEIKAVKQNLYKHYLYDIIRGYWSGSGDSKLEDIIASPETCRYTGDIDKSAFENALMEWVHLSNDKKPLKNVSAESKLLLNYILRVRLGDLGGKTFDVEHCVPKKVIEKHIINKGEIVPISSICNMVFIPENENRGKGEWTYYQKQMYDHSSYTLDSDQLSKLLYPSHEELQFVEIGGGVTADAYMYYLKQREDTVVKALLNGLYK